MELSCASTGQVVGRMPGHKVGPVNRVDALVRASK